MMDELVTLKIEGHTVSVPKGTLIVDAAKRVGIDIPVFCYHPKLEPVGMCRMCLVEVGRPARDRATGEPILDEDGQPVIRFNPQLETACTTPVGEGWVVRINSANALAARKQVVEFLLTSHPLDCPICDKGGECPLQNLTMEHGPGKSRFLYGDKIHLAKNVPLGELIYLDRERCIQCGRCVRFQEEIVDDPVLGFTERGRRMEIVTYSDPGFDSYFSGNTTDICPVGALTTADFRFGARPWELNAAASICPHCPVGCNLTLNTRREAQSEGREVIKRVLPRQNEQVNEIWICDKGRFAHHFAGSPERLERPLIRKDGELVEVGWDEAISTAAAGIHNALEKAAGGLLGIAGGRATNEDLYTFRSLIEALGGHVQLDDRLAGGELVQRFGVGAGTNLGKLGATDAVLVIASDLHEEAPIWWLRLKQAADRGMTLVVANTRPTRLDKHATQIIHYAESQAVQTALGLLQAVDDREELAAYEGDRKLVSAAKAFANAENGIIFYGGEDLDHNSTHTLAQTCANLLISSGHVGHVNNGLIAVWPRVNTQGAWDMGFRPDPLKTPSAIKGSAVVYIMAADPVGDTPDLEELLGSETFVVVQELFLTPTAEIADVVFPSMSFSEREGTYTSGERRVQRFYPAVPPYGESRADWKILIALSQALGIEVDTRSAAMVLSKISQSVQSYAGIDYQTLAKIESQWPHVGGKDLYFGGTAFENMQGLGVQLALAPPSSESIKIDDLPLKIASEDEGLRLVPITKLYDLGTTIVRSDILHPRLAPVEIGLNPDDAERMGIPNGAKVELRMDGRSVTLPARVDKHVPVGMALLPRSMGIPLYDPAQVQITLAGEGETT
jgi:NADH-quinone oxidoreductase subunit G